MKKLTERQRALRAKGMTEGAQMMSAIEAQPRFEESYAEWHREYDATVAMHKARKLAGLTQVEIAERMQVPRSNVSRIESGLNVTIATFTKYLRACGFDFSFDIRPATPATTLAMA